MGSEEGRGIYFPDQGGADPAGQVGEFLSHSYSMSGMGFPLFLQLVLLRSKSWVKTLLLFSC